MMRPGNATTAAIPVEPKGDSQVQPRLQRQLSRKGRLGRERQLSRRDFRLLRGHTTQTGQRFLLLRQVRSVGPILCNKNDSVLTRLSPNAEPVIDSRAMQNGSSVDFSAHWIVMTQFFQDSAIPRAALIDRAQSIKGTILASQSLHSNTYRHRTISNK